MNYQEWWPRRKFRGICEIERKWMFTPQNMGVGSETPAWQVCACLSLMNHSGDERVMLGFCILFLSTAAQISVHTMSSSQDPECVQFITWVDLPYCSCIHLKLLKIDSFRSNVWLTISKVEIFSLIAELQPRQISRLKIHFSTKHNLQHQLGFHPGHTPPDYQFGLASW